MASSIPNNLYSDYQFSPDELSDISAMMAQANFYGSSATAATFPSSCSRVPTATTDGAMLGGGDDGNNNFASLFDVGGGGLDIAFTTESDIVSPAPVASFPDRSGIINPDMAVPTALLDYNNNMVFGGSIQSYGNGEYQLSDIVSDYGDDCCGFVPNCSKPTCPAAVETWGNQWNPMAAVEHTNNVQVGRYTVEERKDRILRYLKKRNQRNFNKTIKYACRKTLADRRVRVRGRFARNNELSSEEENNNNNGTKKNKGSPDHHQEKESSYCTDSIQIKSDDDDDDWLQEAVASLMYVPYVAG